MGDKVLQKVALVTGANRGIGFETARQLGQLGFTVLLGARNAALGEEATALLRREGLDARFVLIDLASPKTLDQAAQLVDESFGRLDVLVNNAGVDLEYGQSNPASTLPMEIYRATMETNLFGQIEVAQRFVPLLKKSVAGRIVNLSTALASNTIHSDPTHPMYAFKMPAYNISKSALNAFTVHLAYELRDSGVKVNSANPGWVRTRMGGELAPMDATEGARTSVMLATLPDDGPTGGFFHLGERVPW